MVDKEAVYKGINIYKVREEPKYFCFFDGKMEKKDSILLLKRKIDFLVNRKRNDLLTQRADK